MNKIKNTDELSEIINTLRASGVNILQRDAEFEIRIKIIQQSNPRGLRFAVSKLPKFNGSFLDYKKDCIEFFNKLREKQNAKRKRVSR